MIISNKALETEKEKVRVTLADKFFNLDFISDHVTRTRKPAMKLNLRIQKPVCSFALDGMIYTQVRTQEQVRLSCLNRYAHRRPPTIQIPGSGQDIMFSYHTTGARGTFFAFYRNNPVHKHEGFIRKTHPYFVCIDDIEFRAKNFSN